MEMKKVIKNSRKGIRRVGHSPGLLEALIFVVVPPLISLSQLFVHLLVLSAGFVLSKLYIGAFESCMSHGIVCEFEVLFAVKF